jgi:hypothetical protein
MCLRCMLMARAYRDMVDAASLRLTAFVLLAKLNQYQQGCAYSSVTL